MKTLLKYLISGTLLIIIIVGVFYFVQNRAKKETGTLLDEFSDFIYETFNAELTYSDYNINALSQEITINDIQIYILKYVLMFNV